MNPAVRVRMHCETNPPTKETGHDRRGDPGGGGQQEGPEDLGRHFALVVLELEVGLQVLGGEAMDVVAVEDTMGWAHGSLR